MNALQHLLQKRNRRKDRELIERTGISSERLQELLESAEPNLNELRLIAEFYHLDLEDLLPHHPRHDSFSVLFRSGGRDVDEITAGALTRRIGYSIELLNKPASNWAKWQAEFRRGETTYESAEANAVTFRKLFFGDDQVSPLLGLPEIATNSMAILLFLVHTTQFEGASAYVAGQPFVFLAERFAPRMLFTLAHEIAHLIGHHRADEGFAIVDTNTERRPPAGRNAPEFYAHAFASCLLMPRQGVGIALRKIREMEQHPNDMLGDLEILLLSRIYGVSFYAAARRCEDLGLLPKGGAASLNETLTKKYGSPEKRAEAAHLPSRPETRFPKIPTALLEGAIQKVRSGEMSVGRASSILGLSIADLLAANAPRAN